MVSYIVLRGCWCSIIVLNVHAPSEEKSDHSKDRFKRIFFTYIPCISIIIKVFAPTDAQ